MKPEDQRIAIAEFCGIKPKNRCPVCFGTGFGGSELDREPCDRCKTTGVVKPYYDCADFPNDLNAMWQAEEKLSGPNFYTYGSTLKSMCGDWESWHADAKLRAEALLRTIGKWKDEE